MKDSNDNVMFSYLYRDAGNYRNYGEIIFSNNQNLQIDFIDSKIKEKLIDGECFVHLDFGVPNLFFEDCLTEDDHDWHTYKSVSFTDKPSNNERDIADFIAKMKKPIFSI